MKFGEVVFSGERVLDPFSRKRKPTEARCAQAALCGRWTVEWSEAGAGDRFGAPRRGLVADEQS